MDTVNVSGAPRRLQKPPPGGCSRRNNVMKQASSLHYLKLPMLLPGITISTSLDDFAPVKQMQLEKFDGTTWKLFGEVMGSGS